MPGDPQAAGERRIAARQLLQNPLTCKEHDPDVFRLIRRHEADLDRWFTQRLGYRLHLDADSARLFKSTVVPDHRPLRTSTGRPFHQLEYVLLALVLASTVAGPAVISLKDLVEAVRSAAVEAEIPLTGDPTERRALVTVLRWMIDRGLAAELHAHVDAYASDEDADAVLKLRPDRIALLPLPALAGADTPDDLLARGERRSVTRQWLRARLVEEPVVYRDGLTPDEWSELRRRLGEEERLLDEMFGLVLESRAEGVAAIDPAGTLAERRFPRGGTVHHAALLLIERWAGLNAAATPNVDAAGGSGRTGGADTPTAPTSPPSLTADELVAQVVSLADQHAKRWDKNLVAAPERLARQVADLLVEVRLAAWEDRPPPAGPPARRTPAGDPAPTAGNASQDGNVSAPDAPAQAPGQSRRRDERRLRLLPATARFQPADGAPADDRDDETQPALW